MSKENILRLESFLEKAAEIQFDNILEIKKELQTIISKFSLNSIDDIEPENCAFGIIFDEWPELVLEEKRVSLAKQFFYNLNIIKVSSFLL